MSILVSSLIFFSTGEFDIHILRVFCNVSIYMLASPGFWLEGYVNIYKNLRFIFSCGKGKPQGKSQDNWIPEMVTW